MNKPVFDLLMEQAPVGFTRVSTEGEITYANKSAREIIGLPSDMQSFDYNDDSLNIVDINGLKLDDNQYPFVIVKQTKTPQYGMKIGFKMPDGLKIISVDGCPVFEEETIIEYVFVFHDITAYYFSKKQLIKHISEVRLSLSKFIKEDDLVDV